MLSALTNNVVGLAVSRSTSIQTLIIRTLHLRVMHSMSLLHPFCYISVTAAQNVGNRRYVSGVGLDQTHHRIRRHSLPATVMQCGVMRGLAWTRSSGGQCETGKADGASGYGDGLFGPGEGEGSGGGGA